MPRLALNKASLMRESKRLRIFERFLPALDLKRRQLLAERAKATKQIAETERAIERLEQNAAEELPMLANHSALFGLVRVTGVDRTEENVLGTPLPKLLQVHVAVRDYPLFGTPHWLDRLVEYLRTVLELHLHAQVQRERLVRLEQAVRKITQRVSLFEKVLIPRTRANIKRITIYLADAERAAVVRAKLARAIALREAGG